MWVAAHATAGVYLSRKIPNLWLLAIAGLLSHIILDWIPHWDYPANPVYAVIDVVIAILLVMLLHSAGPTRWWGAIWAAIPDLEIALGYFGLMGYYFPSHQPWFPHGAAGMPFGIAIQIATIVFFFKASQSFNAN